MDWTTKWLIFAVLIAGVIAGFLICKGLYERRRIGYLRIDRSLPEDGPLLFLEITDARKLQSGKTVVMHIKDESYIPQE